jgi:exopolysaccharide biosynthesis polyprenyl glycosylphosphotransferase
MTAATGLEKGARTWLRIGGPFRTAQLRMLLRALDLAALATSLLVAVSLTTGLAFTELLSTQITISQALGLAGLFGVWWVGTGVLGLREHPIRPMGFRVKDLAKALALGLMTGSFALPVLQQADSPLVFVGTFALASTLAVVLSRVVVGLLLGREQDGATGGRRALVVGTGPRARSIAQRIDQDPKHGTRVIGFVDDDWPGMEVFHASQGSLACDLKNLDSFLRRHAVDEIVMALPLAELQNKRSRLLALCRSYGLTLRFPLSQLTDVEPLGAAASDDLLLSVYHGGREGWASQTKRLMDVVLATVLLVVLAPLIAVLAVLVKLDSPGGAFFAQERVGLNRRRFRMYKFRTMEVGAEAGLPDLEPFNESGGATFKLRGDPRVTRLGRWLRRTSLDELPQLLNVIRGEMSLVGPRPLPVRDFDRFEELRHQRRFSVPPGLTGLWQVSGRSSLPFETWMELDNRYVDEWSLGLDLWILAKTLPAVLSGEGAE